MWQGFGGRKGRLAVGVWIVAFIAGAGVFDSPTQAGVTSTGVDEAPVLDSFTVSSRFGGFSTLSGQVQDENPETSYIQFGGALAGYFAAVNPDGSFSTTFELDPYSGGPVSAQVVDEVGQESNILWDYVR